VLLGCMKAAQGAVVAGETVVTVASAAAPTLYVNAPIL